jgi:hypothetical protein
MGLHTLDTVRRDAAEQRIAFHTKAAPDQEHICVDLSTDAIRLEYTIDLYADCVDHIEIFMEEEHIGTLRFTYLQTINPSDRRFVEPRLLGTRSSLSASPASLWLVDLANGSLMP